MTAHRRALTSTALATPFAVALEPYGEESELWARLAGGDAAALGALYDRYAAQALGLARRILGDAAQAEEVVRDAFLALWRRAATLGAAPGGGRGWLFRSVHQDALERLRIGSGMAGVGVDLPTGADDEAAARRAFASPPDRRRVVEAMRSLPPVQREAIELAFFEGLTHVEIAERLDLPFGTVSERIRLGLTGLRGLIEEGLAR
jgi:RNA polymerase sigma-70 factor (ECF subfamily)